jgi:hypothetical protein
MPSEKPEESKKEGALGMEGAPNGRVNRFDF